MNAPRPDVDAMCVCFLKVYSCMLPGSLKGSSYLELTATHASSPPLFSFVPGSRCPASTVACGMEAQRRKATGHRPAFSAALIVELKPRFGSQGPGPAQINGYGMGTGPRAACVYIYIYMNIV